MPPAAGEPSASAPTAATSSSREQDGAAGTGAASVTPLRKQALLLEARRSRVEWVDAASSPHRRIAGGGTAAFGGGGGRGGGDAIAEILGRPATGGADGDGDGTGAPKTSSDDVGGSVGGSGDNGNGNDGMALLRSGARACASLKSAVPVLAALYDGIPPRQIEERVARQLVSQVSSEDVREILASQSAAAMPPSSSSSAASGGGGVPPAARKAAAGYEVFIQRLRSPEAAELVQGMKHFVASLEDSVSTSKRNVESSDGGAGDGGNGNNGNGKGNIDGRGRGAGDDNDGDDDDDDDMDPREAANVALADTVAKSLHSYLDKTLDTLRTHVLWEKDAEDDFELRASLALETFLFQKCRRFLYELTTDPTGDAAVTEKVDSLQFVTWRHLDIHCLEGLDDTGADVDADAAGEEDVDADATGEEETKTETEKKDDGEAEENAGDDASDDDRKQPVPPRVPGALWSAPVDALRAVDAQWSPTSQLVLIVEAYRGVSAALTAAAPGDKPPGADDALPALILALLHAGPRAVLSNLNFVQHFARAEMLRGEPGYVLTSLWGAVQFLRDVRDASSLTISPEEFAAGLDKCRRDVEERRGAMENAATRRPRGDGGGDGEGGDVGGAGGGGGTSAGGDDAAATNADDGVSARWGEDSSTTDIPPAAVRAARLRGEDVDIEWARRFQRQRRRRGGELDRDGAAMGDHPATTGGEVSSHAAASSAAADAAGFSSLPAGFDRTYTFLGTQPEDVRVSDVPQLLDEYHMLVRACEAMLVERSADRAAEQRRRLRRARDRLESDAAAAAVSVPWSGSGGGGTGGGGGGGSSRGGGEGGTGGGGGV